MRIKSFRRYSICLALINLLFVSNLFSVDTERLDFEIIYAATIKNIPISTKLVRIWIPYPKSDEFQQIYSIKTTSPFPTYVHEEHELGNSFLYLEIEKPTLQEIEVRMDILASRTKETHRVDFENIGELNEEMGDKFEKYFVNNLDKVTWERIRSIVRDHIEIQSSYIDKVKSIYDYVYYNMDYRKDIPGYGKGDVWRACTVKSGNCIDFHSLFVAIAQEAGIVAREVANIDLPFEEGIPNYCSASYHCNVEVYLPNYGWFPIDISHAKKGKESKEFYFGSLDNLRLKLGQGRNLQLAPLQEGKRLERLLHSPYVEIDGREYSDVEVNVLAATYEGGSKLGRRPHIIARGDKAEIFNWIDINGNPLNLEDYLGTKSILINFFSTWCGRCIWETDALIKADSDFDDLIVIRINLMEKLEKVKAFSEEHNISFTVLPDEKGELAKLYGIKYVPTNIIIDKRGIVQFSGGLLTEEDLWNHLRKVMNNI